MCSSLPRRAEPELMDDPDEAAAYARADFSDVNAAFVRRLLELAGPVQSARAVDLGTGPGDIPIRLSQARPQWHITGVDGSASMLAFAAKAAGTTCPSARIEWVQADAKQTPFPEHSFDVLFSNSILHHVGDPERLWAEAKRIARPGALLFFRDLARPRDEQAASGIVARYAANESQLLQEEFYRSLLSAYTCEEVRAQLHRTGLDMLHVSLVTDRHMDIVGRIS